MQATDGIRWHPVIRVHKFSEDQTAWTRRKSGILAPDGHLIRRLAGEPEDGIIEVAGNLLVTVGLNQLTNLIIGGGDNAFSHTNAIMGVGAGTTTPAIGNTALTDDNTSSAYYQQADTSYPTQDDGVITCYCTYTSSNANFAWNEWCMAIGGGGTITAGDHLSAVTSTAPTMVNHATATLGTKSTGSWQLQATITLA